MKESVVHMVFVPMPEVGHLASMVEFAHHLINQTNPTRTITITILTPTLPFAAISPPREMSSPNLKFLDLPYFDSPELYQASGFACYSIVAKLIKPHIQQAITTLVPKVNALVFDFSFIDTMIEVATHVGASPYVYTPFGFVALGLLFHLSMLGGKVPLHNNHTLMLPGFVDPVPRGVLPSFMWEGYDVEGYNTMLHSSIKMSELEGMIVNSLPELEPEILNMNPPCSPNNGRNALIDPVQQTESSNEMSRQISNGSSLREKNSNNILPTIYPVGPIVDLDGRAFSQPAANDVLKWLDDQPPNSVVFLCFGSRGAFGPTQVREIALGIEQSGHRFLWALRKPPTAPHETPKDYVDPSAVLPEGFLDRTAHKGLVCGWVPQGKVLQHVAIGGFVSHCGWNSVLESVWCGVPILAWPIFADQRLNAFLLAKELGLAHLIRKSNYLEGNDLFEAYTDGGDLVTKEEVADGIIRLMGVGDCPIRSKAKDVSAKVRRAVETADGSSSVCLANFVQNLFSTVSS